MTFLEIWLYRGIHYERSKSKNERESVHKEICKRQIRECQEQIGKCGNTSGMQRSTEQIHTVSHGQRDQDKHNRHIFRIFDQLRNNGSEAV